MEGVRRYPVPGGEGVLQEHLRRDQEGPKKTETPILHLIL